MLIKAVGLERPAVVTAAALSSAIGPVRIGSGWRRGSSSSVELGMDGVTGPDEVGVCCNGKGTPDSFVAGEGLGSNSSFRSAGSGTLEVEPSTQQQQH